MFCFFFVLVCLGQVHDIYTIFAWFLFVLCWQEEYEFME